MKKILVLTGSPRKGGNADKMADAFERGARAAGYETVRFEAGIESADALARAEAMGRGF